MPAAVLWDMDGTLVDTEPYWIAEEHELVERYGGTWTAEHAKALVGNDLRVSARYIQEHGDVPISEDEIVEVLLDGVVRRLREHVPWRPGSRCRSVRKPRQVVRRNVQDLSRLTRAPTTNRRGNFYAPPRSRSVSPFRKLRNIWSPHAR